VSTSDKSAGRPFGQGVYKTELLEPTFNDYHHKFILLLPTSERTIGEGSSKQVFREEDLRDIENLFRKDFKGLTGPEFIKRPMPTGEWINEFGKTIADEHVRYEVYSKRNKTAIEYFVELQERLHDRAKEIGSEQQVIVIEQTEVTLIGKPSFSRDFLENLLRKIEGKP